ncbi:MAG TPA: PASTA domain-containing protein [Gemmatimonadota bacterium]|jgi:beta-lactam-binding protein with PASTA domain|nr:PASTA domain-containing protein [Gemmatimonadota bacterium]
MKDFHDRREMVERSRSAVWRVPIALIVATVGAGALGYLGVQLFLLPETLAESRLHRVPDLTGESIEGAMDDGRSAGYEVVATGRQYSDRVDRGDVIYQIPPPGSYLAAGDTLFVLVSLGEPQTRIPDLLGLDLEAARAVLRQLDIDVASIQRAPSELVAQNLVIASDPPAGTLVEEDTAVVVTLSRGGAMVDMPDVRGLPQAAARDTLEIFGLTVGEVTAVGADTLGIAGSALVVVTGQEPAAGHRIATGSAVRLHLGVEEETAVRGRVTGGAPSGNRAAEEPVDGSAQETPENERIRPQGVPDAGAGDAAPADGAPLDERPADEGPAEIPVPDPQSPEDEPF